MCKESLAYLANASEPFALFREGQPLHDEFFDYVDPDLEELGNCENRLSQLLALRELQIRMRRRFLAQTARLQTLGKSD